MRSLAGTHISVDVAHWINMSLCSVILMYSVEVDDCCICSLEGIVIIVMRARIVTNMKCRSQSAFAVCILRDASTETLKAMAGAAGEGAALVQCSMPESIRHPWDGGPH